MTEQTQNQSPLECKWEQPMNLRNDVEIKVDDTHTTFYTGRAWLKFQGLDIWGQAQLTRYDRTTVMKPTRKLISLIPWRYATSQEKVNEDRTTWEITGDSHDCFLSDGKTIKGYEHSWAYRADLRSKALNQGLDLSAELFDRVFNPIDAQVMQLYERAKQFGRVEGGAR